MSDIISTGAYVIRNKQTSTVLHIEDPNVRTARSPVLAHAQAENRYHDQQIWWIEPLVNTEDSGGRKGVVYSITNPPSGKAFGVTGSGSFSANQQSGGPSQWWKFQKIEQPDEGVCYHIVTARNRPISINGKDSRLGLGSHDPPRSDEYCWELVIPAVGYPPGWIQIQNVNTRDILSHIYIYDPPVLLPCPDSPRPSQYREEWQFQWTIVQWGSLESTTNAGSNLWGIKNRLTGASLLSKSWDIPGARFCRVNAWKTADSEEYGSAWKLELDRLCHWKIVNLATGFLLQQTNIPYSGGVQVECVDKSFSLKDGTKSWVLRPPILETGDEASTDLVKQDSSTSLSQGFLSLFPSLSYIL